MTPFLIFNLLYMLFSAVLIAIALYMLYKR